MKRKTKITKNLILIIGIIFFSILLAFSIYANINRNEIKENIKNKALAEASAKASQTEAPTTAPLDPSFTDYNSLTLFVDKTHTLPEDYVPSDLSSPYLNSAADIIQLRQEAGDKAKEMKQAAAEAGINLIVSSGYRSYTEQSNIYQNQVNLIGEAEANKKVASPGASEHQSGLALDFTTEDTNMTNSVEFANTDAGKWLYEHAYEYGWILRYPEGKENITGYTYMPWHYRYVGVDTAAAIHNVSPDETFEEYFGLNQN